MPSYLKRGVGRTMQALAYFIPSPHQVNYYLQIISILVLSSLYGFINSIHAFLSGYAAEMLLLLRLIHKITYNSITFCTGMRKLVDDFSTGIRKVEN
jgi:hypothetical protein